MKHVLKGTTVFYPFNYLFYFFNFCIGFVHNYRIVLYFGEISLTMVKYTALTNGF